jgi:hypothetical protein
MDNLVPTPPGGGDILGGIKAVILGFQEAGRRASYRLAFSSISVGAWAVIASKFVIAHEPAVAIGVGLALLASKIGGELDRITAIRAAVRLIRQEKELRLLSYSPEPLISREMAPIREEVYRLREELANRQRQFGFDHELSTLIGRVDSIEFMLFDRVASSEALREALHELIEVDSQLSKLFGRTPSGYHGDSLIQATRRRIQQLRMRFPGNARD